jgi:hypothetical protein
MSNPPSLNVTVPVATDGVTVAVKVTELPKVDVGLLDATVVVEAAAPTVKPPEPTLPAYTLLASGTYVAFKVW